MTHSEPGPHNRLTGSDEDVQDSKERPDAKSKDPNPWVVIGVYGALGIEFVSFTIAGLVIGAWIDQRIGTTPFGVIITTLLALAAVGSHIVFVTRRFQRSED